MYTHVCIHLHMITNHVDVRNCGCLQSLPSFSEVLLSSDGAVESAAVGGERERERE